MSYDYTVLAGTQGLQNHRKKDRLFELAERMRLPVVFFTEGGGGRPGDTDGTGRRGARLHGVQPVRRAERARAARRDQLGSLLRRQRRVARLLRRRDRDRGLEHRHGRSRDDRRRRPRRVPPRRGRADVGAGAERRRRRRGRRRGRSRRGRQAVPLVLPRVACPTGSAPTSDCCASPSPRTGCASTTSAT